MQIFVPQLADMYWSALIPAPDTSFLLAEKCYSYPKGATIKSQVLLFLQRSLLSVHILDQSKKKAIRKLEEILQQRLKGHICLDLVWLLNC